MIRFCSSAGWRWTILAVWLAIALLYGGPRVSGAPGSASSAQGSAGDTALVWRTRAPMPTPRLYLGVATATNGRIYAIGGFWGPTSPGTTVEEYDPATDTWRTRASMPTSRSNLGVAAAPNGKIYAIGGGSESSRTIVEEYDPATDTWRSRAPMPTARFDLAVATAGNGRIYAIGGHAANRPSLSMVEEYDPATDTWRSRAPMPTARHSLAAATGDNGRIYAIGGALNDSSFLKTVESYDPATDRWVTEPPLLIGRFGLAAATASTGRIYVVGGVQSTGPSNVVEEGIPPWLLWTTRQGMPTYLDYFGLAASGDRKLYAIGGREAFEATVPVLPPPSVTHFPVVFRNYQANAW